jgi:ABC-type Zn uptake system ZnuABC Zn-binding protein ZnuA
MKSLIFLASTIIAVFVTPGGTLVRAADLASAKALYASAAYEDALVMLAAVEGAESVEQVNQIPSERRLLVTNHEATGYFAERYGFTIIGAIIPSLSTDAGTSAQEMAALVDLIKKSGAPAIFLGEVENADLANQIADETGVKVVNDLYLETLTDGAPAATYIDMMKHNVSRIVEALK